MKTILIVNTREKECAVWQYGANLWQALDEKSQDMFLYLEPANAGEIREAAGQFDLDAILYNWHPSQGGFLKDAPFDVGRPVKNLCVFHELDFDTSRFDAVMMSAMPESVVGRTHENWWRIPLLLPVFKPRPVIFPTMTEAPVIGIQGYGGAHADEVVRRVVQEFDNAAVMVHLPPAHYGDTDGRYARIFGDKCRDAARHKPGVEVQVNHEWMEQERMLKFMSFNDMNVYLRPTDVPWHGVSAAMCAALAVRRPLATNRNPSFRHLWDCEPSVCVEDRSLKEILATGTKPLEPIYEANTTEKFVARIEEILEHL